MSQSSSRNREIFLRKMFHKKTLIFSIFLVILNSASSSQETPRVIIVGAGASGIAAASKLLENGFKNITILEAEGRIGGRIHTTRFGDYWVDLGGQWVHGEAGNVAFELAWPLGLLEKGGIFSSNRMRELFDSSGKLMDHKLSNDVIDFYGAIKENSSDYSEKNNGSIGKYFENEFNEYIKTHPSWDEYSKPLLHMFDMAHMAEDAADTWWDVSTKGGLEFHDSAGDYSINWKERGYGTILDILMKRYPNPEEELPIAENTLLNAEVSSISYNDTDNGVTVRTTQGENFTADHVIVTTSLGVLKQNYSTLFQPPLSEERIRVIKALGFGCEAKIYLHFEEPWWNEDNKTIGFGFIWKKEDMALLEKDPEKSWLLGLLGFFFVEHKPNLLYGWISGKYSREIEKLSEQQVFNHSVEALQRFVGKIYNVTTPTAMLRTMWNSNKNFRGTYSYRSVEADVENARPAQLGEPIGEGKPVVLFAGEATSPHHFSTVHGAIETGWREADRLIQLYPNLAESTTLPSSHSID